MQHTDTLIKSITVYPVYNNYFNHEQLTLVSTYCRLINHYITVFTPCKHVSMLLIEHEEMGCLMFPNFNQSLKVAQNRILLSYKLWPISLDWQKLLRLNKVHRKRFFLIFDLTTKMIRLLVWFLPKTNRFSLYQFYWYTLYKY